MNEIWKEVEEDSRYEISDFGRVKKDGEILGLGENGGYQCICGMGLHHLVYTIFSGDIVDTSKFIVHHRDENIYNNRFDNLQKMTISEHTSLHHSGKHLSEETRKKMSEAKSGDKHHFYGKHLSEETRKNCLRPMQGNIFQTSQREK